MIGHNRLQNKVAGSELTHPVCVMLAGLMWWLPENFLSLPDALGLVLCILTAYVIMETNARFHLIRMRTQMMSCVWLVLAGSLSFMHPFSAPLISAALLSLSYLLLFQCYEKLHPETLVFHIFFLLGIGGFAAPVMLPMALLFYFYLIAFLRSMTWRIFWAGIIGLFVPYWCFAVWCYFTGDMPAFMACLSDMVSYELPSLQALANLPLVWQVSAGVTGFISLAGLIHFLSSKYDDEIQIRMMLYIYTVQTIFLAAFLLLQPDDYSTTMAMLLVSASPLIAHYFSLAGSVFSNLFFLFSLLLIAAMATLNLWMTSFDFSWITAIPGWV